MAEQTPTPAASVVPAARALVALVALVALFLAAFCVLYGMTPGPDRPELFERVNDLMPFALVAVPSLFAAVLGVRTLRQQSAQGDDLAAVKHQTNGLLTERMHTAVRSELVQVLTDHGLIPGENAGDVPREV